MSEQAYAAQFYVEHGHARDEDGPRLELDSDEFVCPKCDQLSFVAEAGENGLCVNCADAPTLMPQASSARKGAAKDWAWRASEGVLWTNAGGFAVGSTDYAERIAAAHNFYFLAGNNLSGGERKSVESTVSDSRPTEGEACPPSQFTKSVPGSEVHASQTPVATQKQENP